MTYIQAAHASPPKRSIPRYRPKRKREAKSAPARWPLRLDKNFCNFPLARDRRCKVAWRPSRPSGKFWLAPLPGDEDDGITLRLPGTMPKKDRRAPTAADVNVLAAILGEVQRLGGMDTLRSPGRVVKRVQFPSLAALMDRLRIDPNNRSRGRRAVTAALALWQQLSIEYPAWRTAGRRGRQVGPDAFTPYTEGEHRARTLPPPIRHITKHGRRLVIEIAKEWREIARAPSYWVELPLPLPTTPAAQNWHLLTLGWGGRPPWSDRKIMKKLGLRSSRRYSTLRAAQAWQTKGGHDAHRKGSQRTLERGHDAHSKGVTTHTLYMNELTTRSYDEVDYDAAAQREATSSPGETGAKARRVRPGQFEEDATDDDKVVAVPDDGREVRRLEGTLAQLAASMVGDDDDGDHDDPVTPDRLRAVLAGMRR